jgi:aspartate aminotransferase
MKLDHLTDIHLNLRVRGMETSATIAIQELSNKLKAEGATIYKLGLGQSPFPVPDCVVRELKKYAHKKAYLPVRGLPELREAIAAHHRRVYKIDCTSDDVIIGPGSKELMFLVQLVYYGDIVIPTPSWVSYEPQARIIGRQVHRLPTLRENSWKLVPDQLEALCAADPSRPRLVILNYPSNPGGGSYSESDLKALSAAARRYNILILSDEIYGKVRFDAKHVSIAKYYPGGTILSGGLSKWCGAGGWRLGFFIVPSKFRWLLDAMAVAASETFTSTSAPIQHAAVRAFKGGAEIDRYLRDSRRILRGLGRLLTRRLRAAGAQLPEPEGGFYLFPDFSDLRGRLEKKGVTTSAELCRRLLLETGAATLPGSDFGREARELTLRLSYVDFDGGKALKASRRVAPGRELPESFFERYARPTVEGIDRICAWVRD